MIDEREIIRRAVERQMLPEPAYERLLRRRDRKRRNERLTAGVVAIAVFVAAMWFLAGRFSDRTPTPATQPKPAGLGALAYALDGDIYVANWDGANPVRIADGRPFDDCHGINEYWAEGPMWSPDGRYLAYRHANCRAPREPWEVVISDPEGNVITSFPTGTGWEIAWSPDSTRVAVWVGFERTIGVYGLDGVRQKLLTVPRGWMGSGDYDPVWSRDGDSLLVPDRVEVPVDGSPPRRLPADDPRNHYFSRYSPDGSRVAYLGNPPGPDSGSLVLADADGSHAREIVASGVWNPVWSPSGDRIAFTYGTGGSGNELRVLDVASETVTSLAGMGGSGWLQVIEFSSEGDRILFRRGYEASGVTSLWSIHVDGSHPRRLVRGTGTWGDWR